VETEQKIITSQRDSTKEKDFDGLGRTPFASDRSVVDPSVRQYRFHRFWKEKGENHPSLLSSKAPSSSDQELLKISRIAPLGSQLEFHSTRTDFLLPPSSFGDSFDCSARTERTIAYSTLATCTWYLTVD
jgi:hypothetical protein